MPARYKDATDIKRAVNEQNIQFIRLQFTDIFGTLKNIAITADELDKALSGNMMFDGSSIEGFVRIEESDMYLYPDPSTFTVLPWFTDYKIARLICDIYKPMEGSEPIAFAGDPRRVLKNALDEAAEMGYEFFVGPECEFFLFQTDENGAPTTNTHDQASYFDLAPIDNGEVARIDMVKTLMDMGFQIEAAHHENAPGQHEIDFKYSDALNAVDNIMTFKLVVKVIAKKFGLHATFMPKPLDDECGSGMHCNMSLFRNGKNAFYDPNGQNGLSEDAYFFMGGLLKHAKAMTAITNPSINSYKRLVPGYEAPVYITWSTANRSPLIRVPVARGNSTRLELRHPDPSCNPYLALAVMLRCGLDGIKKRIKPPAPVDRNIYHLTDQEMTQIGIDKLPADLNAALEALQSDELILSALGDHVVEHYIKAKRIEWMEYIRKVHPWEVKRYM